ncbi:hypothetical protein MX572_22955 (plasmid) [Rhodococcus pyridinivorans]|uniref:hypothetical protein n=1 Tax=Rhodococcus pyridinivorans TaxID=103816 RepID=UPI0020C6D976|nr:hypothetical protein [Rhodococcus pyridinivorans]UTM39671.1 hypothetical protein MX572_22955 [Rhodococcus pyridinivorans]
MRLMSAAAASGDSMTTPAGSSCSSTARRAADLTDVDLLCVSTDLSNPFTVVGKVEAVTGDDTGAMVAGTCCTPTAKR